MANNRTYETFLQEVDAHLLMEIGVPHEEIEDWDWMGAYENGADPKASATQCLEDIGYFQS